MSRNPSAANGPASPSARGGKALRDLGMSVRFGLLAAWVRECQTHVYIGQHTQGGSRSRSVLGSLSCHIDHSLLTSHLFIPTHPPNHPPCWPPSPQALSHRADVSPLRAEGSRQRSHPDPAPGWWHSWQGLCWSPAPVQRGNDVAPPIERRQRSTLQCFAFSFLSDVPFSPHFPSIHTNPPTHLPPLDDSLRPLTRNDVYFCALVRVCLGEGG
jgi:hypothetical protein